MYDFIVIGGGIVGLSTAWQLQRRNPGRRILLIEKESTLASHQSGHNSGVVHAGIYYQPGSLKARFCRQGVQATMEFCRESGIPFEQCGKLIVATTKLEQARLRALFDRARENHLEVELLDAAELSTREPAVRGLGAIFLKTTGITDFRKVSAGMAARFQELGGEIRLRTGIRNIEEQPATVSLETGNGGSLTGRFLLACGGLQADRLAQMMNLDAGFRIIPFRGEYYRLAARLNKIVNHLIYPVPDPALPFLGVHLTRMIDGPVTVGPNAVQGWKREAYGQFNFDRRDSWDVLTYPGFWRLSKAHLARGLIEYRNSLWKRAYLAEVHKYCPQIELRDLEPHPAGVRAQAVLRDGSMVHDFLFAESRRSLHVCNAPSPAATSAIPIGEHLCAKLEEKLASTNQ